MKFGKKRNLKNPPKHHAAWFTQRDSRCEIKIFAQQIVTYFRNCDHSNHLQKRRKWMPRKGIIITWQIQNYILPFFPSQTSAVFVHYMFIASARVNGIFLLGYLWEAWTALLRLNVNSKFMLKSDQFLSHKKSLKRLTVRQEWHKNSFWLTLTCTKFSVCVSCISCTFRSSSSTLSERELLITVLGIQFHSFHPQ